MLERDVKNGSFWPSYVLCSAVTTSSKRSGWRVVKQFSGNTKFKLPKVLVTSIYGHDDMVNYLSDYRTQDKMHGVHYYPKGALCWFETNQYGDFLGSVYYIKQIPDMKLLELPKNERGYKKLLAQQKKKLTLKEKWAKNKPDETQWEYKKPRFKQ